MSYAMRKASELVGQCAVWKVSKSRNSMQKHGPLHSWRILSTLTIMTYLYRIHIDINRFYIQEATLKDTSRTMSLLIIQTCYNLHVSKPRFQTLEYTIEKELHYIPWVYWNNKCNHLQWQANKLVHWKAGKLTGIYHTYFKPPFFEILLTYVPEILHFLICSF